MSDAKQAREAVAAAMRPNVVDRIITFFDPEAGARRIRARGQIAAMAYVGASTSRPATREWRPALGSADADTLVDLPMLRARSRDAVRNQPLATGALSTALTETIGPGFTLKAQPDREALGLSEDEAERWERRAERIFRIWCRQADITRRQTFQGIHWTQLHSTLESGDVLVVRRMKRNPGDLLATKIQLVEADRISNPDSGPDTDRLTAGVEMDADGAPIAYHVQNQHPYDYRYTLTNDALKWTRLPAFGRSGERLAWLIYWKQRPGQTRGVPWLAPVIEPLKQIADFGTAELHAAVVNSLLVVVSMPGQPDGDSFLGGPDGKERLPYTLGSGLWLEGNAGDQFEVIDPKRPNTGFEQFVLAWWRQIGAALGVPFELLIKHFNASFSASQAAMLQAYRFFRTWQQWQVDSFCQPIYELVMVEAVATGLIDAPGFFTDTEARQAWLGSKWIGPNRGMIRPDVEIRAAKMAKDEWFASGEDLSAALFGDDWEHVYEQRAREERRREAAGFPSKQATEGRMAVETVEGE